MGLYMNEIWQWTPSPDPIQDPKRARMSTSSPDRKDFSNFQSSHNHLLKLTISMKKYLLQILRWGLTRKSLFTFILKCRQPLLSQPATPCLRSTTLLRWVSKLYDTTTANLQWHSPVKSRTHLLVEDSGSLRDRRHILRPVFSHHHTLDLTKENIRLQHRRNHLQVRRTKKRPHLLQPPTTTKQ